MEHHTTAGTLTVGELRRNLISGKTVSYEAGTERRHRARAGAEGVGWGGGLIPFLKWPVVSALLPRGLTLRPCPQIGCYWAIPMIISSSASQRSVLQKKK